MTNNIQDAWLKYAQTCISPHAGEAQLRDLRRFFFAGAESIFSIIYNIGKNMVTEERGCEILDELRQELVTFAEDLQKGQA